MKLSMFWAHHQEPKTAPAASGFLYLEGCFDVWLVDVVRRLPDIEVPLQQRCETHLNLQNNNN
jgi:hypothetical protein